MSEIFDIANDYVKEFAQLDPINATFEGIAGHDDDLTDYSPDGFAKQAALARKYVERARAVNAQSRRDIITRDVMVERLTLGVEWYEADDYLRDFSFAWSPVQAMRSVFDQMQYDSKDNWEDANRRLAKMPKALQGLKQTLDFGIEKNVVAARRQVLAVARQARIWAGRDVSSKSFFDLILDQHREEAYGRKLGEQLRKNAEEAARCLDEFSDYLVDEYAAKATDEDAVGRDRYLRSADSYLGMRINPEETYEWGWQELARLDAEIKACCALIKPGATLSEIIDLLNDDHERWIEGENRLTEWLRGLLDRAIQSLDGVTFDIPMDLKRLEVRIAPPGGPANQYYVPPSEDLSRPGTYWYPTDGRTRFPMWAEISTAYHEGVPGHHLQCGVVKVLSKELSRFQRNMFVSGHGEGWALYAERLMDELGFYERPEYRLDMLLSHYFRAARVVTDIGLHLQFKTPDGNVWTPEFAHKFMLDHCNLSDSFVASEIVRYLGIPAQAISYKVGEKVWLDCRAQAQQKLGADFNLRKWHNDMLALGPVGLEQLKSLATVA